MFRSNNKDTRMTSTRHSGVYNINFEQISHIALVFVIGSGG